jgi:hypothetical protein
MKRALLLSLLAVLGCDRALSFGVLTRSDAGGPPVTEPDAFSCSQRGPLLGAVVRDGDSAACGAASDGFHYAVCSCDALINEADTDVDGFDSAEAPYAPGQASGALGLNGALFGRTVTIGGSLTAAGAEGIPLLGDLTVGGHLRDRGQLQGPYAVTVGGDFTGGGDVRLASLAVAGRFQLAQTAALELMSAGPTPERTDVTITPPCSCDAPLDIASLIDEVAADNDNERLDVALDGGSLKVLTAPLAVTLPCGQYYLSDIYAGHALTLRVAGRAALYLQQGIVIDPTASLTITLDDDAELDLFVGGGMAANGPVAIGAPTRPSGVRMHFAGQAAGTDGRKDVIFGARATISGSLYAPRSEVVTRGEFTLYGAALVRRLAAAAPLHLHYDRAMSRDTCNAAACTQDDDCDAALRCDSERCLP